MWGGHPKSCGLGLDTYFRIHSHQLIFDLPCYSALLSAPIWHTTSFHSLSIFFFSLYRKEIEVWETAETLFLHCFPDSPCGEGKRRNQFSMSLPMLCQQSHIYTISALCLSIKGLESSLHTQAEEVDNDPCLTSPGDCL